MNRPLYFLFTTLLIILTAACSQESEQPSTDKSLDRGQSLEYVRSISFLSTASDTISTVQAALADDDKERGQGLMDIQNLPADKGMLFIFEENKTRGFWMANTPLPLDIIFVNSDKQIVRIHHNTEPFSQKSLKSGKPAQYVIETNAGYCISHDIQEGMKVAFE
jgi:uncharacterized membrane protein (UPF0127 family)